MSKLCTGVLALVFAGCVMVPDYQRVSSDEIVRAYDLAARVDADTRSFAAVSSNVNKTASEMGQAGSLRRSTQTGLLAITGCGARPRHGRLAQAVLCLG